MSFRSSLPGRLPSSLEVARYYHPVVRKLRDERRLARPVTIARSLNLRVRVCSTVRGARFRQASVRLFYSLASKWGEEVIVAIVVPNFREKTGLNWVILGGKVAEKRHFVSILLSIIYIY